MSKFIDENFKLLIVLELGLIMLFLAVGGLFAMQKVSALESRLDKVNSLIDKLPLEELMNRCDNIDCVDRVLGKVSEWDPCWIGVNC